MKKTRVYAIEECDNVHEISNEEFMYQAEEQGYVWSLLSFQNFLNCEGEWGNNKIRARFFSYLHFRFIDIEI